MRRKTVDISYKPGRRGTAKILGELEGPIMEALWVRGSGTVREIHEGLGAGGEDLAYTTVMTVMTRLCDKGYLMRKSEGNAYRYSPTSTRDEFVAQVSRQVFAGMSRDLSGPVLSAFVDKLSDGERRRLEDIARLIETRRKGSRNKRK